MSMTPPPTVVTPTRRRLWVWILGVAVLVAGGAVGLWWWLRPAPPTPPLVADIEETDVRQAITEARQRVLQAPRSASAWGNLGLVFLAHRFDDEATFCFTEAARLDGADPRWPYGIGMIVVKHDLDAGIVWLRQAATAAEARDTYRSAMRLQLAESLLLRSRLTEAEELLHDEELRDPSSPRVALGLGQAAVARGDSPSATKYLLRARSSPLARKRATVQLAALARARGDLAAADAYELQIAAAPDDPHWPDPFLEEMVQVQVGLKARDRQLAQLEREHRYGEAAEIHLQLLQEHPKVVGYIGAGTNLARAGDYKRGLALLRKAVEVEPDNANAHMALAVTLLTRAEKQVQAASPSPSPEVKDWFRDVIEHARRAAELRPDHSYAYLYWGMSLKYLGEPAAAIEPLRKGVACQPANMQLQLTLGEALLEAGQPNEARTYLDNARLLAPNDPRPAQALERLQKALSRAPE
jgi:Flp pilus assembly protein TadD